MLMQATMFLAQPKRARLLVLREPIKQAQDNPRVTMLTLDITFHPPAKRARLLVCRNVTNPAQVNPRVTMLMQATIVSGTTQTSQTACAAGTYQSSTGQSSCDDADAGYYVSGTAQTSQTACAAGTFSSTTGSISCTDALPGYYVPAQGQTSATECLIGYYQSASGQTSCDIADIGYYVEITESLDKRDNQVRHNALHQPPPSPRAVPLPCNAFPTTMVIKHC